MASAPIFGSKGVVGPMLTLFYTVNDGIKKERVNELVDLAAKNFIHLAERQPKEIDAFKSYVFSHVEAGKPLTPIDLIKTPFLQSMEGNLSGTLHKKVMEYAVPSLMKDAHNKILKEKKLYFDKQEEAIEEWVAKNFAAVSTEKSLNDEYEFQELLGPLKNNPVREARTPLGTEFYREVAKRDGFTENDFDTFVATLNASATAFQMADHPDKVAKYAIAYIQLAFKAKQPVKLLEKLHQGFDGRFRKMMYEK